MKCAVITPVGPGHAELFAQIGGPSVEQAKAYDKGPFDEIHHYVMDDTVGRHGRSARRNEALQRALDEGIDWVFFLDADDKITPNAFEAFGRVIAAEPDLDAVWGLICTLDEGGEPELRDGQPITLDSREEFLAVTPFHAVQIGGFYRTSLAARFGFDTSMDTGEDYKFYAKLWAEARCAKRPEIFFLNRRGQHSTGPRSATGADWSRVVTGLWRDQLEGAEVWLDIDDGQKPAARMRLIDPADPVQACLVQGRFFGLDALEKLRALIHAPHPAIAEVGAGVGNTLVWCARNLAPSRIFPVEANPAALALLEDNIAANGLDALVDRRGLGVTVGARTLAEVAAGGAPVETTGAAEPTPLDEMLDNARVDVLRISAEVAGLVVLDGAVRLIARDRPLIWISVPQADALAFVQGWCRKAGYRVADSIFGPQTTDYFVVPKEAP